MPNNYPEWQNCQFAQISRYIFFFLHTLSLTIVFKLGYALFHQFYAEISTFSIKKCSVRHLSTTSWYHARGHLTSSGIRRKYPEQVKIKENRIGYARKEFLFHVQIMDFLIWYARMCFLESKDCYLLSVQFLGPRQNVQTQIRRHRKWHLIRVYTVCFQEFLFEKKKWKSTPDTPKFGNGLIQLIRLEKSTRQIWVN